MKTFKEFVDESSKMKYHSIHVEYDEDGRKKEEHFNAPAKNKEHATELANKEYSGKPNFNIISIHKSSL
jgi:hypothetical protein